MTATLDVGRSLVRGSAWTVGLRWALRGLGLINTFILARLLTPADFGLVAMAMVVIGLVEVMGQFGQGLALIRHQNPTREDYDSVWTLSLIIAAVLTAVLWAVAPLAALYFHEPRARWMIELLALRTAAGGLQNVGVFDFRRDLRFDRDFAYQFLQRILVVGITIACAVVLRDWRALAAGILAGQILGVAASYVMHPYRPRLCVRRIPDFLGFSGWMLAVHTAQYINGRADQFVVGGTTGPAAMGLYNVAADVGTAPAMEITLPVERALFPVFAKIRDDAAAVRVAFLDLFAAVCMISIAVGLGTALVAQDFVAVALGARWAAAVPLVRLLAIAGGLYGIMQAAIPVMSALGHARLSAKVTASRAVAMVAAVAAAAALGDVEAIAWARTLITLVFIPGIFLTIARVMPVSLGDMAARGWRPLVAGGLMAAAVLAAHAAMPAIPLLRLGSDAAVGAASYAAAILLLWWLAGRPAGLEAALIARARRWLAASRG
jgi:lipopolysaccharide exporter